MATLDGLSPAGAKIQAEQIERYWAERGGRVITRIEVDAILGGNKIVGVRSDMVGGLPREWWTK